MTDERNPRVFVVEDHPIVRRGIASLIEKRFDLVGSADEVGSAVEIIREREPDLVLLDVHIPGGGGAAVIEAVRRTNPSVKFLVLTVSTSREDVARMFDAGVDGYIVKSSDEHLVLDAIDHVLEDGRPVSQEVAGYLLDIDENIVEAAGIERLTPREREVTTLIARGYTYREAAARLEVSVKTLENHMAHIFGKLGLASRHELTRLAYETGFLRPDDQADASPSDDSG